VHDGLFDYLNLVFLWEVKEEKTALMKNEACIRKGIKIRKKRRKWMHRKKKTKRESKSKRISQ
jgi:hypothetical protein